MEKRVLIISYYWPPTGGSGVQRWVKFAKYLPSEGWQPVIYTPLNPEAITVDESLLDEIPPQVEVIRRKIFEPYNIYRALTGKKGRTAQSGEVNPINSQEKSFTQKVAMWIRGNMFIPDPRCFWIGPSVRFLKEYLKEHPVDIIVSTGPPHSMHLIARKVARATGIPWVADFRDPWTKMFYFKHLALSPWAQRKHVRLEKMVLDDASVVVAVSPLVQDEFKAMTTTEVDLITNGFDEDDFAAKPQRDEYFSITHTGLFASDGNPDILWKVLAEKCRRDSEFKKLLRIRLAGKTDKQITESIVAAGLGENLEDLGYCNHNDAVCLQKSSSLLILPLRKEPEYRATLPGKLFEYLASERPILGIGQTDGAMARIISQTQAGFVFGWEDSASISRYIDLCWERFRNGTLKADTHDIGSFSRRSLTHRMACLFDRLTGRS
ncbi:MAG: glycosyltransferase [Bacteroidales bacterium]|nr:glycosyltransferase [Bacteroidales bacterium]